MNKVLKVILAFLLLANIVFNDRIIPDPDFPLLVKTPRRGLDGISTAFEFRFKLPIRTSSSSVNPASGIGYHQYFGIKFTDGLFSFASVIPGCTLTSATAKFNVVTVQPASSALATQTVTDTKIIYCKLDDKVNPMVPGDTTLTLTLTFGIKISTAWIHNIAIFTSTSNNPDQLIIDNLPTFGSVGLYSDYTTTNNNKLIQISNGGGSSLATVTSPSNVSTNTLYPGFTFDTRIVLQVMQYWMVDPEDFIIYLKYDTTCFLAPTGVSTEDVSTNANEKKLTSIIQFVPQTDGIIITGFANGELYPNRKFKLVVSGMRATDGKLEVATQIELLVYYKNTYSIVSYANINMDIVKMVSLTAKAYHPELFNVYDGMAWPFQFEITSPQEITTGGFVVIRHKSKDVQTNNLNFVASTCEFLFGDQGWGKRNNCFPLRNDFNHDTTTGMEASSNNEGSGIFFKMSTLAAGTKYSLKVWAFIEKCYGGDSLQTTNYAAALTFTIRIFKKANINDTYLNESIFFDLTKNYVLARNIQVPFEGSSCFPLQTRTDYLTTDATTIAVTNFDGALTKLPLSRVKWTSGAGDINSYNHNLPIGIELHNLTIIKPASTTDLVNAAKSSSLFFTYDDAKATEKFPANTNLAKKYLYGSTSSELSSTNLTFFALYQASKAADDTNLTNAIQKYDFQDYIPNECASKEINSYIFSSLTDPRIQWVFNKDFLTASANTILGTSGCQVSWLLVDNSNRTTTCMNKTLFYGTGVSVGVNKSLTTITSVDITPVTGTSRSKNMVISPADPFKITSEIIYSGTTRNLSMTGLNCFDKIRPQTQTAVVHANTPFYNTGTIGVHTNCLSWKSTAAATSMFSYFEVQQLLIHNVKIPTRIIRYIKLFPEPGFFQDPTDLDTTPTATNKILDLNEKWIVGHYEATTKSVAPFAVCLLEINASIINAYKTTSSNTLVIWLFSTSLLDIDVNDTVGQYPVAPVTDTAYGLNSGQTISIGNRRISDTQNWNVLTSGTQYPDITASEQGELEMIFSNQILGVNYISQAASSAVPIPGFKSRRTMYQFFLGSVIYIPTSSDSITGSASVNMYIPFLCPSYADETIKTTSPYDYPKNGIYFVAPIVTVAWANMSSHSNITKIESYINPALNTSTLVDATGGTTHQYFTGLLPIARYWGTRTDATSGQELKIMPLQTPIYLSGTANTDTLLTTNPKTNTGVTSRMGSFQSAFLKASFRAYNDSVDRELTLKLVGATGITRKASALSIFLNEDIGALSTSVTGEFPIPANTDNKLKVKAVNTKVYIMGKPFTRFLAYAVVQYNGKIINFPNSTPYSEFTITDKITINGIPRLEIAKYNSVDKINPLGFIAVFTHSGIGIGHKNGQQLTNLRLNDTSKLVAFLLWHPDINYANWDAVISLDNSEDTIKDDKGGNFKLVLSTPSNLPIGTDLTITMASNILATNISVCGLIENGQDNVVTNCNPSGNDIVCKLSKLARNFEICCYNIINNNTKLQATIGQTVLNQDTSIFSTTILSYTDTWDNVWYKYPQTTSDTAKLAEINFTRLLPDISTTNSLFMAKLVNIIYTYSSTLNGIGKALFEIRLPRAAVRGMSLNVKMDLTSMKIANFKSKIVPTFGNSDLYGSVADQGDIFLDSVYSNLDTNGIKLKLKNILYKCGLKLSRDLRIYIWPILTATLVDAPYSIEMKGPDSNNLSSPVSDKVSTTPSTLQSTLVDSGISLDFMTISSIVPRIVDEYTEYTFSFNFSSFATSLENKSLNEIIIFFPQEYYEHRELLCYNGTSRLSCNFLEVNMLSIRLGSAVTITSDTRLAIRLVGIINPYLTSNNGVYFACAVNNTDFRNEMRTTLIRGTATINEGTLPSNNEVVYGNLVFKNKFNYNSFTIISSANATQGQAVFSEEALNPREDPALVNASYTSLHQFGLTLDIANNSITGWENGLTINTPNLYITFPRQYRFELRTLNPTVKIEAYFMDQTDNTLIAEQENFTTTSSVTLVGNQLRIAFTQTSWTFSKYFQYFIVKVYGIPPPDDNVVMGISSTETIRFTLFNNDRTVIYRTWPNLNSFSELDIGSSRISDLLPQIKGFKYEYDNKRWIIDVKDKVRNVINDINLCPGRYNSFDLTVRTNNKFITPATAEVGLESSPIVFEKPSYTVSTAAYNDVSIKVGVACNVDLGDQVIRPKILSANVSSIYNSFLPLAPVVVRIVPCTNNIGKILFTNDRLVRRGGSTYFTFTLSEPTFSDLVFNFEKTPESEIVSPITIKAGGSSARGIFRMLNPDNEFIQTFTTPVVSDCYDFQHEMINFRIASNVAIIPNDAIQPPNFAYYNSSTDNTLLGNQIKFVFTSIYTEVYIYCALTCLDKNFPTDEQLKNQNVTSSNTLAYFSDIITGSEDEKTNSANTLVSTNIVFSNLVRGQKFKLKCIIESTQANTTLRTSSSLILTNYTSTNGTVDYFIATKSVTPICTSYRFVTRPGIQVTNPLLFYWQSKFSAAGYYETGCVTAVDQYGTSASGLPSIVNETNCGTANCRFIDRNNYVVNQTSLNVSETYTICAYPLSYCDTDPTNYEETYTDIINTLPTNTSFPAVLNTLVVPSFTITRISDGSAPSTPTVSNVKVSGSKLTFDAKSSSPITCFVKSAAPGKTYTSGDFESCGTGCLVVDLTTESESFSLNVDASGANNNNNSTAACSDASVSYKVYGVCFNSAPCSNLKTNVLDLGTGVLSTKTGNCTSQTNSTSNTTNSSYISLNIMIFFIMALILLA